MTSTLFSAFVFLCLTSACAEPHDIENVLTDRLIPHEDFLLQSDNKHNLIINNQLISLETLARFSPIVFFHPEEKYFPCSIESILRNSTLIDEDNEIILEKPSEEDLLHHSQDNSRLSINPLIFQGDALREFWQENKQHKAIEAPMYVSVQVPDDFSYIDIHYIFLFAYNGPQSAVVRLPFQAYDVSLPHFAEHEGDIESVSVRVSGDFNTIIQVRMEAHGYSTYYEPNDLDFKDQHVLVRSALNSHASYNGKGKPVADTVILKDISILGLGIDVTDFTSTENSPRWAIKDDYFINDIPDPEQSSPIRFIGINMQGDAIGQEKWVLFSGRIGNHFRAHFVGSTSPYKQTLSAFEKNYVDTLVKAALLTGNLDVFTYSNGTAGLQTRAMVWVNNNHQ